ncbi:MAG: RidA family protein [Gemmatimonadales bacterium]|nr:RidA family protein [Gemmatimonadales bacterium]
MSIQRVGITDGAGGMPRLSRAVIHGETVYLCGVVPDPSGGVADQTRQVLERIDQLLATTGTNKSRLLTAQIWLSDMKHFAAMNGVWNAWVDPTDPPVRACVQAELYHPEVLVEIMVTAAR